MGTFSDLAKLSHSPAPIATPSLPDTPKTVTDVVVPTSLHIEAKTPIVPVSHTPIPTDSHSPIFTPKKRNIRNRHKITVDIWDDQYETAEKMVWDAKHDDGEIISMAEICRRALDFYFKKGSK